MPEPLVGAVKHTGFRVHGKSKDRRDDLPQVWIEMAVTRDGILRRAELNWSVAARRRRKASGRL